jgi:DNA-binding NarL/FixJ family response regulator
MNLQTLYELQARATVEPEVKLLLRQLLALVDNGVSREAVIGTENRWNFQTGEQLRDEIILQFELGGVQYKLMRSTGKSEQSTSLSPREQEIVQLVSHGYANKTIAHKLSISQHTVNTHVRRIFDKLGVSSRAEMVAYALQSGLVGRAPAYYN